MKTTKLRPLVLCGLLPLIAVIAVVNFRDPNLAAKASQIIAERLFGSRSTGSIREKAICQPLRLAHVSGQRTMIIVGSALQKYVEHTAT